MSEEFDIFDANMNPAHPFRAPRKQAHAEGLWHQTFHCWVLRRNDAGEPQVFLQLRAAGGIFGNTFDISAAGHLQAGETVMDGAREVEEELGLPLDPAKLLPLGIYKQATDDHVIKYYNREFAHTFFYETDHTPADCRLQEEELDGLFEISVAGGLALFSGAVDSVTIHGISKEDNATGYKAAARKLRREDMWGHHDRCVLSKYYLRVFQLAAAYFDGNRNLNI